MAASARSAAQAPFDDSAKKEGANAVEIAIVAANTCVFVGDVAPPPQLVLPLLDQLSEARTRSSVRPPHHIAQLPLPTFFCCQGIFIWFFTFGSVGPGTHDWPHLAACSTCSTLSQYRTLISSTRLLAQDRLEKHTCHDPSTHMVDPTRRTPPARSSSIRQRQSGRSRLLPQQPLCLPSPRLSRILWRRSHLNRPPPAASFLPQPFVLPTCAL